MSFSCVLPPLLTSVISPIMLGRFLSAGRGRRSNEDEEEVGLFVALVAPFDALPTTVAAGSSLRDKAVSAFRGDVAGEDMGELPVDLDIAAFLSDEEEAEPTSSTRARFLEGESGNSEDEPQQQAEEQEQEEQERDPAFRKGEVRS